ncbi:LCP family protein [Kitasatospora sp. NPDC059817]|uniref:LCP family protein n=1 Tax=Kitasatospora sp. NPDC059817 TaxID=3346961 RepID=UPI003648BC0D
MAEDDTAHPPTDPPPTDAHPSEPGRPRRRRRWLMITAGVVAFLLVATGALLWIAYRTLDGNIRTDSATDRLLARLEAERPSRTAGAKGSENILLIGSDDRSGTNSSYGGEPGTQRSDTTILLHLAADRKHATAVSIPRDVMVTVPACEKPDGTRSKAGLMQFNWAFEMGGAACSIRAVEQLSGIRIDHYVILDFNGFKTMVNAIGGVEVCVPQAIHDKDARLDLPAGRQTLHGEQALGYVRARESLGDGSDTQRMGRQQQFLAALIRKVQSQGVLLNPARLWPVLDAATSSVKADGGLSSLGALYDLTQDLRDIPSADVVLLTAPRRPYRYDSDRDEFVQPQTTQLFTALRDDRSVAVRPPGSAPSPGAVAGAGAGAGVGAGAGAGVGAGVGAGASPSPSPSPVAAGAGAGSDGAAGAVGAAGAPAKASPSADASPTFEGRTADVDACAQH